MGPVKPKHIPTKPQAQTIQQEDPETSGYQDIQESCLPCPTHTEFSKVTKSDHEVCTLTREARDPGLRKVLEGWGSMGQRSSGLVLSSQAGSMVREKMSLGATGRVWGKTDVGYSSLDGGEAHRRTWTCGPVAESQGLATGNKAAIQPVYTSQAPLWRRTESDQAPSLELIV